MISVCMCTQTECKPTGRMPYYFSTFELNSKSLLNFQHFSVMSCSSFLLLIFEFCISFPLSCLLLFCFSEIIYPAGFTSIFFERSREVKCIHFEVAAKRLSLANKKDKLSNKCYKSKYRNNFEFHNVASICIYL